MNTSSEVAGWHPHSAHVLCRVVMTIRQVFCRRLPYGLRPPRSWRRRIHASHNTPSSATAHSVSLGLAPALTHTRNDNHQSYILVKDRIFVHLYTSGAMLTATGGSSVVRWIGKRLIGAASGLEMIFETLSLSRPGGKASRW